MEGSSETTPTSFSAIRRRSTRLSNTMNRGSCVLNGEEETRPQENHSSRPYKRKLSNAHSPSVAKAKRKDKTDKPSSSSQTKLKVASNTNALDSKLKGAKSSGKSPQSNGKPVQKFNDKELEQKYTKRIADLRARRNISGETEVFKSICSLYEHARRPDLAVGMAKYMRDQFMFFGLTSPNRRTLNEEVWSDVAKLNSSDLRTLVCQAWYSPEREFQHFTVDLLEKYYLRLYADDLQPHASLPVQTLDFVGQFVSSYGKSWWDTVDPLSYNVVGPLVRKFPDELLPEMDKWNVSQCKWMTRTSLIYQLKYNKDTDKDRLFRYCLKVSHEEEFFIQKAMGWALRNYFRYNPVAVRDFVKKNKSKLSSLCVREALKHDKQK